MGNNDNLDYLKLNVWNIKDAIERNDYDGDGYDALLSAELLLPNKSTDGFICGTVIKKKAKNNLGKPIGTRHADANLDNRRYVVRMSDCMKQEFQHNLIATNIFTQANSEVR